MTIFVYENKRLYPVYKTPTFIGPGRSHGSKINSFDFLQFFQDAIFVFIKTYKIFIDFLQFLKDAIFVFIHIYILLFVVSIPLYFNICPNKLLLPPSRPSNATLQHISKRIPRTKEELLEINGIGK